MSDEDDEKGCDCVPGLPPWMGTFADLMSLLMCFFVLLLSFSEMDAMKFKRLAGSMAQAFGVQNRLNVTDIPKGTSIIAREFSPGRPEPTPINEIWQQTQDVTEMSLDVDCAEEFTVEQGDEGATAGIKIKVENKLKELLKKTENDAYELAETLSDQIESGQVEIETRGRLIIIRIREKGSFVSGSAQMSDEYKDVMREVRAVLASKKGAIAVQGHTDDIPIKTSKFRSNWDLSAMRSASVAQELMYGNDVKRRRFEVTGYADTKPLVPNDSAKNRAINRRVEILIKQGLESELEEEDIKLLKGDEEGWIFFGNLSWNQNTYLIWIRKKYSNESAKASAKMNQERRRYFRITEAVGLTYQYIDGSDGEPGIQPSTAPQALIRVSDLDEKIDKLLAPLAETSPEVAELIMLFNQKLERVVGFLSVESQIVGRIAQKVKQANVSACGIGFENDEYAEIGTRLRLELTLFPTELKIVTYGRVVGCNEQDQGDEPYYWRVDFYGMSQVAQEKLIQHMVRTQTKQLKERGQRP